VRPRANRIGCGGGSPYLREELELEVAAGPVAHGRDKVEQVGVRQAPQPVTVQMPVVHKLGQTHARRALTVVHQVRLHLFRVDLPQRAPPLCELSMRARTHCPA
jgi:hypothetical protein